MTKSWLWEHTGQKVDWPTASPVSKDLAQLSHIPLPPSSTLCAVRAAWKTRYEEVCVALWASIFSTLINQGVAELIFDVAEGGARKDLNRKTPARLGGDQADEADRSCLLATLAVTTDTSHKHYLSTSLA